MKLIFQDIPQWIKDNKKYFAPPVGNKLMHNEQLKIFFVQGPNQRKDFHLECGEEFFYQLEGDMNLIVQEGNTFRDIPIKQGEVFLLPGKIPHSPQRNDKTLGLVIERERKVEEKDAVRYFQENSNEILFERWFYCDDLGTQLVPLIKEFFASEEKCTGKPKDGSVNPNPPYLPDASRKLQNPFSLQEWLQKNKNEINSQGYKKLFEGDYESDILVLGKGNFSWLCSRSETWLWQLEGASNISVDGQTHTLKTNNSLLVPKGASLDTSRDQNALTLLVTMDPK